MAVYKRGKTYWYSFYFRGKHYQESTGQGNERVAHRKENARQIALADEWKERDKKAELFRCKPEELLYCPECEKLFNGAVAVISGDRKFCSEACSNLWNSKNTPPAPTLAAFSQRFLDNVAVGRRTAPKESTVLFYADCMNQILAFGPLAGCRVDMITQELVERFINTRKSELSPARINGMLRTLRRCLSVAVDLGLIVKVPRFALLQGERERTFVLSPEQEQLYLEGCPQPLHDVAILSLETGVRLGEACGLEWKHVHLDPVNGSQCGFIHVATSKTKYGIRDIPLTERVSKMLASRLDSKRSIWVFENEEGTGPLSKSTVCHQHSARRRLLKMPNSFVVHGFRHTMLTKLGSTGADAFLIKMIAGHSSVAISEKYIHPVPDSIEMAFNRFEQMTPKSLPEGSKLLEPATDSATAESELAGVLK